MDNQTHEAALVKNKLEWDLADIEYLDACNLDHTGEQKQDKTKEEL